MILGVILSILLIAILLFSYVKMVLGIVIISIPFMALLWFMIFKLLLKIDKKNPLKDIAKKIEKQDKKFYNDGKEVNLKEQIGLIPKPEEPKPKEKKSFLSIFKRKKKLGIEEVGKEPGEEEVKETEETIEDTKAPEKELKKEIGENEPSN